MKAIDVRAGYGVKMDGKLWVIVGTEFRNPGNLRSFVNIKFRNVHSDDRGTDIWLDPMLMLALQPPG